MPCILPTCGDCENYEGTKEQLLICKAFPGGIPEEYFWCKVDVKKLGECRNGYKFEDKYLKRRSQQKSE